VFYPTKSTIECMIDIADTAGPIVAQRAFFQRFVQLYATLLPEIIAVVEQDSSLHASGISFIGFASTHRLAGITIPELNKTPVEWDIWFEPIDTTNWGYSVEVRMVDDTPQVGIGISA
jgi:hypothetical protein